MWTVTGPSSSPSPTCQLIDRYGDMCFYCGIGDFECVDHVVCVRVGGHHTLDNAVPSCHECNQLKRWAVDEVLIRVYRLLFLGEVTA